MQKLSQLKELLEKESFPLVFMFKLIGKNTEAFDVGIRGLEAKWPNLIRKQRRTSQNHKHLSMTYDFEAASSDEILNIYHFISKIEDLLILL